MAAGLMITRGSEFGLSSRFRRFDSNATLTAGDCVNVEAGQLELAGTGDFIAGVIVESTTNAGTGIKVNCTPGLRVVMDNDNVGTTFAATHVFARFDIAGTTGAQVVDTSSLDQTYTAPTGQLLCLEYNPQGIRPDLDTDVSVGLFMIKESQAN